jgi:uncharacterized repeat protein (TIGR03803 family)
VHLSLKAETAIRPAAFLLSATMLLAACAPTGGPALSEPLSFTPSASLPTKSAKSGSLGRERLLHAFHGPDGGEPTAGLIMDAKGNLYGTSSIGGRGNAGVIFELSHRTGGSWKETVLHSFNGFGDGKNPAAGLVLDAAGNLYGTTPGGGKKPCFGFSTPCGLVYELSLSGKRWKETVLHYFNGVDGAVPLSRLTLDAAGNIYGTTSGGGNQSCALGCGVVFELKHKNAKWSESIVHMFDPFHPPDGEQPQSAVIFDSQGNLYGTTPSGEGPTSDGAVFELTHTPSGWTEKLLLELSSGQGGGDFPSGDIVLDSSGNLFGTTSQGGSPIGYSEGVVYELPAGTRRENVLLDFVGISAGSEPTGGVIVDAEGNLYGTTEFGGVFGCPNDHTGCGNVFSLSSGNESTVALAAADGNHPVSGLIRDAKGNLYGTARDGDDIKDCPYNGCGSIFEVTK